MTITTDPALAQVPPSQATKAQPVATTRDPRLDFFRGIAMFIILIAHAPGNWLALWIPARFGFSDATEIFVFCSGMASAIAFGKVFRLRGFGLGAARVAFRVWQVYWAHIGLFIAVSTTMVLLNHYELGTKDYVGQLNLYPFFKNAELQLFGLLTLTYVPNYFDILPMYLVVLAMMPLVVLVGDFNRWAAFAMIIGLWFITQFDLFQLPAELWNNRGTEDAPKWSTREWFFNPFGWQLIFFTGFAFMSGWLPPPPVRWWLIAIAIVIVVTTVPFAYFRILREVPELAAARRAIAPLIEKTDFGLFRYLHFLALAYVGWCAVGPRGNRLLPPEHGAIASVWRPVLAAIMKVGQQSLAVFIASMYLARLMGVALDDIGRTHFTMALVNITGILLLIALAYGVGWFKSQPWRTKRA
ncbi:OpgC family protein [Actibacterium sp. 188UL27-1]|uniref:OpgC family protein n=1 Tax=Actibacterium sp. 188UL27-1 TaxID=2786961 RepID=UPI00195AD5E7|nr:OpgC domain-containing protein [Actibacterium sp. 188UL27-1]MBM7066133.1 OpgC domain-containing protein [Actibacterium sp. 188UL27-1]